MKICAGISSVEEYISCCEAGADEVYFGYVPPAWTERYGFRSALNRREVAYCNVQLGSEQELRILKRMVDSSGVPAAVTFNSPFYSQGQYDLITDIMEKCIGEGFDTFIVADAGLLLHMYNTGLVEKCRIHISGESSAINSETLKLYMKLSPRRIILPRRTDLKDMEKYSKLFPCQFEAFILNENCIYSGHSCCSLHTDEMCHMCNAPCRPTGVKAGDTLPPTEGSTHIITPDRVTGETGCGLCMLWKLRDAGITHLKIVSRGAFSEDTLSDIKALRRALSILAASEGEDMFISSMKRELFPSGCSGHCYY